MEKNQPDNSLPELRGEVEMIIQRVLTPHEWRLLYRRWLDEYTKSHTRIANEIAILYWREMKETLDVIAGITKDEESEVVPDDA